MIAMNNAAKKLDAEAANDSYALATEDIRAEAARLLAAGEVAAVVGYRAGRRPGSAQPLVVTSAEQAKELIFSPAFLNNLALYLTRTKPEIRRLGRLAVVAKGCDLRAIAGLVGESQLKRDELAVIGVVERVSDDALDLVAIEPGTVEEQAVGGGEIGHGITLCALGRGACRGCIIRDIGHRSTK